MEFKVINRDLKLISFVKESINLSSLISFGWGNGYVAIPPTHPFYKKDYDFINSFIDIHGGLTFSQLKTKENAYWFEDTEEDIPEGWWVVGFDTKHYGDTIEKWPKEAVEQETERLKKQLENYELECNSEDSSA